MERARQSTYTSEHPSSRVTGRREEVNTRSLSRGIYVDSEEGNGGQH
jgi:hypothetical protein